MIKVGIIGGAGYTAGELIRLLINHPEAEITFVNSQSNAGHKISDVHGGLLGDTDLEFTDQLPLDTIDVLFFCMGHGDTRRFLESHTLPEGLKVIDLSMDYRLKDESHDFVYGLPELNRRATCSAQHVANPGCFATAIQLALLPLAKHLMLNDDVMVTAITGSTGAGVKPQATSHFSWRDNNLSVYKAFQHQHVPEIKQSILQLQQSFDHEIDFIPVRGDFPRGIFAMVTVKTKVEIEELYRIFTDCPPIIIKTYQPVAKVLLTNRIQGTADGLTELGFPVAKSLFQSAKTMITIITGKDTILTTNYTRHQVGILVNIGNTLLVNNTLCRSRKVAPHHIKSIFYSCYFV